MARYRIEDEGLDPVIVDTDKAKQSWEEDTRWNGNNHISVATGSEWKHEKLYQSAKGRWWIEHTSQWQGSTPVARMVPPAEAARWLLANGHDLPEELAGLAEEVCE
jgi:hypothetical protein